MNIIPKRLRRGDTIGIIAPAGPVTPDEIQPAIHILKDRGYRVREGTNLYKRQGYLAGSDEERLHDFHEMFRDNNVKAILCARGGYGTQRLLDKINFDIVRENPKFFIGYSDITALLLALNHMTGLVVCHGPMARNIRDHKENLDSMLTLLSSGNKTNLKLSGDNVLKKGKAVGRLLGGNLSIISSLSGTSFLPSFKECLLFIEERGEPLYKIDRMLTQLKLGGALDGIKGVIAGSFQDCEGIPGINGLLLDIFSSECPVYTGFPAGHGKVNLPILFGIEAELNTEELIFIIKPFTDLN